MDDVAEAASMAAACTHSVSINYRLTRSFARQQTSAAWTTRKFAKKQQILVPNTSSSDSILNGKSLDGKTLALQLAFEYKKFINFSGLKFVSREWASLFKNKLMNVHESVNYVLSMQSFELCTLVVEL